ncbi:MAG: exodeoxyribonuclease VII large subunit, partial [Terrimicrobiaceae bacterium]
MQLDLDFHQAPVPPEPRIHSVTELTRRIRELIERGIGEVWVEGEISNHRRQTSGHQYFTLKDDFCQLPCVLFSSTAAALPVLKLTDGQRVQALGMVSVYEPRGQYQMVVRLIRGRGQGLLQAKFEALKQKLAAEGLFEAGRKRPLPRFPRRVGLVTSPTGAAIRDFLKVLHRRHPGIEVLINPVRVQGKGAGAEIARAIRDFGESTRIGLPSVDVVVVTRGGGSIEDLWEFNEEIVARAIAASPIPVLSAIGHEIDFTIADFVADLRAPTPSAAAEILAADRTEVLARLKQDLSRLNRACVSRLQLLTARIDASWQSSVFREPSRRIQEFLQTLDRRGEALGRCPILRLDRERNFLDRLKG